MDRTILHCDCNGFYASVECLFDPSLKDVPMAVCGDAESRHGIILAKNELAKKYDIQTAETIWRAKQKCPKLVLVQPHREAYVKYSGLINKIYEEYTDLVEPFGIDESYLDVTGSRALFGDGKTIADTIRERIKKELGLTISVGVSFNKVFAKLGSDYKKPDATTVISRENYKEIVWPLPVSALLFVGHSTEEALLRLDIKTIGELALANPFVLEKKLGKAGLMLSRYARAEDNAPVSSVYEHKEAKSIGNSITFKRDLLTADDIRIGIASLSDMVATRLRKHHVKCWTVQIIIKDDRLKSISRQKTLFAPTNLAMELEKTALELISGNWTAGKPIRMLSVQGSSLVDEKQRFEQLNLFSDDYEFRLKREKAEQAIDKIREKFGKDSISTANVMNNDIGVGTKMRKKKPMDK
ncbi:MAG: DNA polymerase IV [Firmicutes bacterium]|nr:DNA polymerase IV [Bacillota bacterium]